MATVVTQAPAEMTSKRVKFLTTDQGMPSTNKGFNINLSRVGPNGDQNSMLAYTEKLRNFKATREQGIVSDNLQVQAKHIPKFNRTVPKNAHRKPLTLQELTGGKARSLDGDEVQRSLSPTSSLPVDLSRDNGNQKLSFFSSSDLNDIVGYRIKKEKRRNLDTLQQDQLEQRLAGNIGKSKVADYLRSSVLPPIPPVTQSFRQQVQHNSPRYGHIGGSLRRPKRAKRMELRGSFLQDIPECDSSTSPSALTDSESNYQTVSSCRLQSRNSILNQGTAQLVHNLDSHVPSPTLSDKLGIKTDHILIDFSNSSNSSPRHHKITSHKLDQNSSKQSKYVKDGKVKRLVFLSEQTNKRH